LREDASAHAPDELIVSGIVSSTKDRPIRQAVVSILRMNGEPADWSRSDNDGEFSVVLPEPGSYLVVASADGWAPRSEVMDFDGSGEHHRVTLTERLRLNGRVTESGRPCENAVVTLVKSSGEYVATTTTAADGTYELGQPPGGRYVVTVLGVDRQTATRQLVVLAKPAVVDLELGEDLPIAMAR
jgi:hypothetical protein